MLICAGDVSPWMYIFEPESSKNRAAWSFSTREHAKHGVSFSYETGISIPVFLFQTKLEKDIKP